MTVFYDPLSKKTKMWIFIIFVIVPLIICIVGWIVGKDQVSRKTQHQEQEVDIFKK